MKIYKGTEEYAINILADAVKSLDMTDKQILAACKPKLPYYATMTKWSRRTCLWCHWSTDRYNRNYTPESIQQIEEHYMEAHYVQPLELAA